MVETYALFRKADSLPLGKTAFSLAYARMAPYFWTVRPKVRQMHPHYAELSIAKRRAVQNHIGTLHAIAVCNGLEAAMGLLAEATVGKEQRWIPKGMTVAYLAKSTTDLLCVAETGPQDWPSNPGESREVDVRVRAVRTDGVVVVVGTITIWVTPKG